MHSCHCTSWKVPGQAARGAGGTEAQTSRTEQAQLSVLAARLRALRHPHGALGGRRPGLQPVPRFPRLAGNGGVCSFVRFIFNANVM